MVDALESDTRSMISGYFDIIFGQKARNLSGHE